MEALTEGQQSVENGLIERHGNNEQEVQERHADEEHALAGLAVIHLAESRNDQRHDARCIRISSLLVVISWTNGCTCHLT